MRRKSPFMPALALAIVLALVASATAAEKTDGAASKANGPEKPQSNAAPAQKVRMVEFRINERRVVGRLLEENEDSVRVRIPGSGTITFARGNVRDLKRYTVGRALYEEKLGDYYLDKTWDFENDEQEFANALKAYLQAIAAASESEQKERLRSKYRGSAEQRRAWQEESMRREKLQQARDRSEAARLQKELAQKKLDSFENLAKTVKELQSSAGQIREKTSSIDARLSQATRHINKLRDLLKRNWRALSRLHEDVEWLEDEVDDLEDFGHHH
jgi:archaellum component FlaC